MTDTNQASEDKRPIFKLLWNMQNEIERNMSERGTGTLTPPGTGRKLSN